MVIPARSNRRHRHALKEQSPVSSAVRALEEAYKEADARKSEAFRRGMLPDSPTLVDHGPLRVLVSATPTPDTMDSYIRTLTVHNVTHVVRVCEEHYPAALLTDAGFELHDWFFPDGDPPPPLVVGKWLALLDRVVRLSDYGNSVTSESAFAMSGDSESAESSDALTTPSPGSSADLPRTTVAIHCAAGLGRSPALVAVALVELGLNPAEAVGWLRALRRGAINAQQCAFLYNYQRRPLQPRVHRKSDPSSPAREQTQHRRQCARVRSALTAAALWAPRWSRSLRSRSPSMTRSSAPNSPRDTDSSSPRRHTPRESLSFGRV